jgi:hypothetical protein
VPCSGFVWTYGVVVCGYPISEKTKRFPDKEDYKRSILGYVTWLRKQIGNKNKKKTGHLPGTPEYWLGLFKWIILGFFKGNEKSVLIEAPRTLFKLVTAFMNDKEEQSFYSELKDEKAFKQFMLDCMPEGKHEDLADRNEHCWFTVANASRPKAEKFKVTYSDPENREEVVKIAAGIMMNSGLVHAASETPEENPTSWPINWEKHDGEAAALREQYER